MIMEVLPKYSWNLKEMVFKCQIIFVDCLPCLFCQKLILVWHIVHIYFNYNAYAYALYFTYQIKLEHPYYFQWISYHIHHGHIHLLKDWKQNFSCFILLSKDLYVFFKKHWTIMREVSICIGFIHPHILFMI